MKRFTLKNEQMKKSLKKPNKNKKAISVAFVDETDTFLKTLSQT